MKKSMNVLVKAVCLIVLFAVIGSISCACSNKKKSGKTSDSSLEIVYTKSDAVKRAQSNNNYTIYGVTSKNDDGTVNLKKYNAISADYGRTINILSESGEDVNSVVVDDKTKFDIDKLKDEGDSKTGLELFMSKIGKRYKGKPIYFEMTVKNNHAESVRFFSEYYR